MALFKAKQLPTTSYGYRPPPGVTAKGWSCPNCGRAEWEATVKRWPAICECGTAVDPTFNEPWAHDARGMELRHQMADPEKGKYCEIYWPGWHFKDSALKGDRTGMFQARAEAKEISVERIQDSWWIPGGVWFPLLWEELETNELDSAAEDLSYWLSISTSENVEDDNTNRTNCRQAIDMVLRFTAKPGTSNHPLMPQIRSSCLELAAGAFSVLNNELQAGVNRLAREAG
jgi:hypothetical protein